MAGVWCLVADGRWLLASCWRLLRRWSLVAAVVGGWCMVLCGTAAVAGWGVAVAERQGSSNRMLVLG